MLQTPFIGDFKALPSQGKKGDGKTPEVPEGFLSFADVAQNIAQQAFDVLGQVRSKIHTSHPQSQQETTQNENTGRSNIFADPEGATLGRPSGSVVSQAEPAPQNISGKLSFNEKTHDPGITATGVEGAPVTEGSIASDPVKNTMSTGHIGKATLGTEQSSKNQIFAAKGDPHTNELRIDLHKGIPTSDKFFTSDPIKSSMPAGIDGKALLNAMAQEKLADPQSPLDGGRISQNQTLFEKSDPLANLLRNDSQIKTQFLGTKPHGVAKSPVIIPEQLGIESAKTLAVPTENKGEIEDLVPVMKKLAISDRDARGRFEIQNNILKGDGLDEAVGGRKKMWAPIADKEASSPTLTKTPVQGLRFSSPSSLSFIPEPSEPLPGHVKPFEQAPDPSRKPRLEAAVDQKKSVAKSMHRSDIDRPVNAKAAAYNHKEKATVHFTDEEPAILRQADSAPKQAVAPTRLAVPLPDASIKASGIFSKTASPPGLETALRVEQIQSIVNKTAGRFVQLAQDGGGRSVIVLRPERLGRIRLEIDVKDSVAKARITTESQSVRVVLETEAPHLREALQQHGIQLDQLEIKDSLAKGGFEGANENTADKGHNTPGRQSREAKAAGEIDLNEKPRAERQNYDGTISVTA